MPEHGRIVDSRAKAGSCEHHTRIEEQRRKIDEHCMSIMEHRKWIVELEQRMEELNRLVAQKYDFATIDSSDRRRRYCLDMGTQGNNTLWRRP